VEICLKKASFPNDRDHPGFHEDSRHWRIYKPPDDFKKNKGGSNEHKKNKWLLMVIILAIENGFIWVRSVPLLQLRRSSEEASLVCFGGLV